MRKRPLFPIMQRRADRLPRYRHDGQIRMLKGRARRRLDKVIVNEPTCLDIGRRVRPLEVDRCFVTQVGETFELIEVAMLARTFRGQFKQRRKNSVRFNGAICPRPGDNGAPVREKRHQPFCTKCSKRLASRCPGDAKRFEQIGLS